MSVRIGLGLARLPMGDPRAYWRFVERCETSAVDSLWQTDRLVSEEPFLEAMTAMGALAGATRRIKFGMNAVVVPFRDPLLLAKQCATIDYLSGGRLLPVFGVGGERAPEWRASGRGAIAARGARADEALTLMQRLWTEERVSFEGRFYQVRDVTIAPRPLQRPLPCWIGGSSPAAVRRTARLGTGWLGGTQTPRQVHQVVSTVQAELQRSGRRIDPDHFGASLAFRFGPWDAELERLAAARAQRAGRDPARAREELAVGDAGEILAHLRAYHAAGASKFVLIPLARSADDLLAQTERVVTELIPEVHAWPDPAPASSLVADSPNPD